MAGSDVPLLPQIAGDRQAVGQIHTQHSRWCPAVEQPGIDPVFSVGVPYGREVGRAVVGTVGRNIQTVAGIDDQLKKEE